MDDGELADESVEKDGLVVVGVGGSELVVGTQLKPNHEAFHLRIDLQSKSSYLQNGLSHLTSEIAGDHVECDELVAAGDDVAIVGGELHGEDGKLVTLQAVFERPAWRVHAVIAGHQRVLLDSLGVTLPKKIPDVVAVFDLRKKATNKLGGEHTGVELEDSSPKAKTVSHKTDFL